MKTKFNLVMLMSAAVVSGQALSQSESGVSIDIPSASQAEQANAPTADASTSEPAIEEVIITAQRRAERAQDVPISVTSLSAEAIAEANIQSLSDVAEISPGVRFDNQGAFAQPTIRGVGTSVVTSGGGSNVGIYVDGFYSPNPLAADFDLLSVRGIQILKGPQGTLFGRNTTGGAILVNTAKPSTETSADVQVSYGRFNTQRYQAYGTTGLTDSIAVDVEGLVKKSDGFVRNIVTGSDDDGGYDNWAIRTGLNIDLSERVSVLLRYQHSDNDDSSNLLLNTYTQDGVVYAGASVPPELIATRYNQVATGTPGFVKSKSDIGQITVSAELDSATLTSYTQYRNEETLTVQDLDNTGADVWLLKLPVLDKTFSQELLLASNPGGRLQWTTGLFFFEYDDEFRPIEAQAFGNAYAQIAGSTSTTRSYAAYVDATYEVIDDLFLTTGIRYSHDEVVDAEIFNGAGYDDVPEVKFNRLTPRLVLRYALDPKSSVYASFNRGYKAGLIDLGNNNPTRVDPESINAFEVGYKYATGPFSLDASTFYYDYKNLQVSSYPNGLARLTNAASSRIWGVDTQTSLDITSALQVSAGATFLHAEYKDFESSTRYQLCTDPDACGALTGFYVTPEFDASGMQMQRSPKFTGNLGIRHTSELAGGVLVLSGSLYYTSSFYFDLSEQFKQKSYGLLGAHAAWTDPSDRYTIAVYGDNLTDKRYKSQVFYNSFGIGAISGMPVTAGVSLAIHF